MFTNVVSSVRIIDIIDIAIVAFGLYKILNFIQETRAEQIAKGLLILLIATKTSDVLHLYTIHWILKNTMTIGVIAIIIVFQPELRRALEYLGRGRYLPRAFLSVDLEKATEIVGEITDSVKYFSDNKIGALIIFENQTAMGDIMETGTRLDARISKELLLNIFAINTALHDGAVIISGDRIAAASCVLPLSANKSLSKELGTRHRAGIGLTENSDALALIVSEETGTISIAIDGKLSRSLSIKAVSKIVMNIYVEEQQNEKGVRNVIKKLWRRNDG